MERIDWSQLLSHSHWIAFNLQGQNIRLCARCLGTVLGFSINLLILLLIKANAPSYIVLFSCALCAPAIVDWVTQSWGLRNSSNKLRLLTGFMEGTGIALLSILSLPFTLKFMIVLYLVTGVFVFGSIGKWFTNNRKIGIL